MQEHSQSRSDELFSKDELREMIVRHLGADRVPRTIRVVTDTSDFFRVDYDDVVMFGERPYLCRNTEREGRFGIDDEPKFWVRRAVDLVDGTTKIIKMVFHERFSVTVGGISFECVRSPKKEARILDLVKGHPNFMQGFSVQDSAGNTVRIIEFIPGEKLADSVLKIGGTHEDYFFTHFPGIMDEYIVLVQAIRCLHEHGEKHGDIRRDHIIRDKRTGECRWIDFDFNYIHKENMFGYDLFGLGNVIVYLAGRGDLHPQDLKQNNPAAYERLCSHDMNIIFNNRVVNLQKVYPYIPDALTYVLLHFSLGADVFYETTDQLLEDLQNARTRLG